MKIYQTIIIALCVFLFIDCSAARQTKSPTEVMRALNEASKTKDVAAVKNSVSKGTLVLIGEAAKAQNLSVDEILKKDDGSPFKELPEIRNEKIEGDAATIEMQNATTKDWEIVPFVKEDGNWKLALDKYLDDMKKKMAENVKTPPTGGDDSKSNASQPNDDKKPKEATEKPAEKLAKSKK